MIHGTLKAFWRGCRCTPCRAVQSKYNSERQKARKNGDFQGFVSAARARRHLKRFSNLQAVADVLGCHRAHLWRIESGSQRFVRVKTERRILAVNWRVLVKQRPLFMSDGVRVPAKETHKKVALLRQEGFMVKQIAAGAGIAAAIIVSRKKNVTARTAMKVEKFFRKIMAA